MLRRELVEEGGDPPVYRKAHTRRTQGTSSENAKWCVSGCSNLQLREQCVPRENVPLVSILHTMQCIVFPRPRIENNIYIYFRLNILQYLNAILYC